MGRLSNLRMVDPVLTNLALGYTNNEFVGEHLMPFVPVDKEANKLPRFGKEAFKIYNTERALRAKSNRINPEGVTFTDLNTDEHDLEYPIDYREDAESAFPLQAMATDVTSGGLALRREKMIADLAQNTANYPASNRITLSGNSQFSSGATSDPIGVVEDGKEAIRQKTGKRPNTAIIGAGSLKSLKFHPSLVDKIKYTGRGIVRLDVLRELFDIENIYVGEPIYSTDADSFIDIWADNIVLAYVPTKKTGIDRNLMAPSYGYTPRRKGNPVVDVRTEDGKVEIVRATDNFRPYIVSAEAGYLIKDTNA